MRPHARWTTPRIALGVALLIPTPLLAQRASLERLTHQETLANGMHVIVFENHAVPLATVEVVVKTGAMTQTSDDQGVPHLFEHMLFKGYHGPLNRSWGEEMGAIHGGYNGTTAEEDVTYYVTLPSENTDAGVRVLANLVRDPNFDNDDLQKERFVVLGEMQRDVSEPQEHLDLEMNRRLWGAGWPRKNPLGDQLSLMAVTPIQLKKIFGEWYVPNNSALIVTGDVSAPAVFAMAEKRFGGWKQGPDPFAAAPVPPMPALDSTRGVVVPGDVNDVTVQIEWQGPSVRKEPNATYAADVLSDLLEDKESQFQRELVDAGLFHAASLSYQSLDHTGPITFWGTTTADKLPAALTVLNSELARMGGEDYFKPSDLQIAEKRRAVRTAFQFEEGAQLAHTFGYWWAVAGLDYYLGYSDNLSTQGVKDVRAFVNQYITGKPYVIGILTPAKDAQVSAATLQQYIQMTEVQ